MKAANERNTFRNLPHEKRERIIAEAVREFAENGFRKASVNAIVKRSAIAKGSLYQYFKNKEGLFLFVFERFTLLVKRAVKDAVDPSVPGDFFMSVRRVLIAGVAFIDAHPEYFRIYARINFESDLPNREELLSRVRLLSHEFFTPLCQEHKERGLLRHDVSVAMMIFVLDAVIERFLQAYAKVNRGGMVVLAQLGGKELESEIDNIIDILRNGLAPR